MNRSPVDMTINAIVRSGKPGTDYYVIAVYTGEKDFTVQNEDGDRIPAIGFDVIGPYYDKPDELDFVNILDRHGVIGYVVRIIQISLSREKLFINTDATRWENDIRVRYGR